MYKNNKTKQTSQMRRQQMPCNMWGAYRDVYSWSSMVAQCSADCLLLIAQFST